MLAFFRRNGIVFVIWLFTAASSVFTFRFVGWVYDVYQARSWPAVECRIVDSHVEYNSGNSRLAVTYDYTVGGKEYQSSRYEFSTFYTSRPQRVSDELQPGKLAQCYVDPEDPSQAVIERDFTFSMLGGVFSMLFFLFFGLVSIGGFFHILDEFRKPRSPTELRSPTESPPIGGAPTHPPLTPQPRP